MTFGVRTAVILMRFVLWEVAPCRLIEMNGRFRENWCLLHQERKLMYLPERRGTSVYLHGITPYKTSVCRLFFRIDIGCIQFIGDLSVARTYQNNTIIYAVLSPHWRYVTSLFTVRCGQHFCRKIIN